MAGRDESNSCCTHYIQRTNKSISRLLCSLVLMAPIVCGAESMLDDAVALQGNTTPEAHADSVTTPVNTEVVIPVLENDLDADGDTLMVITAEAKHGTVAIEEGRRLRYIPSADFIGDDEIVYTVFDGKGSITPEMAAAAGIDTAALCAASQQCGGEQQEQVTLRLQINFANNDATVSESYYPEVAKLAALMARAPDEGVTIEGHTSASGSDSYNQKLSERRAKAVAEVLMKRHDIAAERVTAVGYGESRLLDPSNTAEADAKNRRIDAVFDGTFSHKIQHAPGTASAVASVNIYGVNQPPVAQDDQALVDEGSQVTIKVLGNDQDGDGDPIQLSRAQALHGTVVVMSDGTLMYTPDAGYHGADSISYTIVDDQGGEAKAAVAVTVRHIEKPLLWYVWGDYGYAKGAGNKRDLNRKLSSAGVDATITKLDNERSTWQLGGGYRFNQNWSLELGYVDLGEVSVQLTGTTTSASQFYGRASRIHPQSANGWLLTSQYYWPFSESIGVLARVGVWYWQSSYTTYDNAAVGNDAARGADLVFGLGGVYKITEPIGARLLLQRYYIGSEVTNMLSFGLTYRF